MSADGSESSSLTDALYRGQNRFLSALNLRKPRSPEPSRQPGEQAQPLNQGRGARSDIEHRSTSGSPTPSQATSITSSQSSVAEERLRKLEDQRAFERMVNMRRRVSAANAALIESPEQKSRYGEWDAYHVETNEWQHLSDVLAMSKMAEQDPSRLTMCYGTEWRFRARIHVIRNMSSHLAFVVLREHGVTMQAVLSEHGTNITSHMMHWVMRLSSESLVFVQGTLQKPREVITGCDIAHLELHLTHVHLVSGISEKMPFTVYAAERALSSHLEEHQDLDEDESLDHSSSVLSDADRQSQRSTSHVPVITQRTRLSNRLVDLRTPTMQAVVMIPSVICREFRQYLSQHEFIEIHTPKLQGGASESGASVFDVAYFGRSAFLAQSPQLYKQMCIAADMRRVFEIGPVFRAENSNTARHLTEYTGLDLEMEINHYYDAMSLIDRMLKHIFTVLRDKYGHVTQFIRRHYPSTELQWLEQTLVLPFWEGVRLLKEDGYREEDGSEPSPFEDLATRGEIRLGEIVKRLYGTDYYILDKFPRNARPFYTLPDQNDERYTNSFDIFLRGQEICTGGQRIHHAQMLEDNISRLHMDASSLEDYLEGFRLGAPPHAGCGLGLERLVMLYLNLDDIRLASLFYRDPKSFPTKPPQTLRYLEGSTNPPPWLQAASSSGSDSRTEPGEKQLQPLGLLIANYGDSTNTSWLDDRITVWRDQDTGAAIGYWHQRHYVLIIGNPLCDMSQYNRVIERFLEFVERELRAKPIWLMVSEVVESILGSRFGWCTLTCTDDQRIPDVRKNPAKHDHEIERKIRHADKVGVSIQSFAYHEIVPEDVRAECDEKIKEWSASRRGTQVHLTDVRPWVDQEHRQYFFARDSDKKLCCLVVLAQLAPIHGAQVKWALNFPNAPNGAIEMTILHALDTLGSGSVTFGTAASPKVKAVHGLSGLAFKILSRVYNSVSERTHLLSKGDFRDKLGTVRDPTYICYPKGGMSMLAVREVLNFFRD